MYYTLRFSDLSEAVAVATELGFWDAANNRLRTDGQSVDPETGEVFSWSIVQIGQDPVGTSGTYDEEGNELTPPIHLEGYFVNCVGRLPAGADAYLAPGGYGCAGVVFAKSEPPSTPGTTPGETTTHAGHTWIWQQARWPDGTFRADDPATPGDEAFEWVIQ